MRIVAFGASLTAGTPGFFSPRERPPHGQGNEKSQYAYWMMRLRPQWEVLNRGMRGQRTDHLMRRFDYDVIDLKPEAVILLAGTNDLYQGFGTAHVMKYLKDMYDRARQASIRVVACSVPPLNLAGAGLKEEILDLNRQILQEASVKALAGCDLYRVLEDPEKPGFLPRSPDQVHPDIEGYRRMAEALTLTLEKDRSSAAS